MWVDRNLMEPKPKDAIKLSSKKCRPRLLCCFCKNLQPVTKETSSEKLLNTCPATLHFSTPFNKTSEKWW